MLRLSKFAEIGMERRTCRPASDRMASPSGLQRAFNPSACADGASIISLQGYLPLATPSRGSTLTRKREEYKSLVELAFSRNRDGLDQQIWHQIEIDVPRTRPGVHLWQQAATQRVSSPSILRR